MINIEQSRLYCAEDISIIEGYNQAIADTTQMWVCHHRRGLDEMSREELKEKGLYTSRPASELMFVTEAEHKSMHMSGKHHPLYGRRGEDHPAYGYHHTEAAKELIRQSKLGKHVSDATRGKISQSKLGENNPSYGTHWFNNGFICVRTKECPPGFKPGRLRI